MYRVEEKHILRDKTITYFHKFKNFGQCIEYCSSVIEVANYEHLNVVFSVYDDDEYLGVWNSGEYQRIKEYKNANKTKTSNL